MNMAGGAITSLNSPSDSEIFLSPSPQEALLTSYLTSAEGVIQYEASLLCALRLGVPPAIWFVACSALEHPVADPCDGAGNSVPCVVFGYPLSQEMIVVVPERILSVDGGKGSSLVDRFEYPAAEGQTRLPTFSMINKRTPSSASRSSAS